MPEPPELISASDVEAMSPQERADVIDASIVRSWDDVPDSFRDEVMETARELGEQRRQHA